MTDTLETNRFPYEALTEDLERLCAKHGLHCCTFIGWGYLNEMPVSPAYRVEVIKDTFLNFLNDRAYEAVYKAVTSLPSAKVLKEETIYKKPATPPADEMPF